MCPSLGAVGLSALYLYLMSLNPLDNTVQASSAHFKDEEIKVERDKGNFLPGQWQLRSRDGIHGRLIQFCLLPALPHVICLLMPLFPVPLFISLHLWLLALCRGETGVGWQYEELREPMPLRPIPDCLPEPGVWTVSHCNSAS